jgi:hypothetical protein
MGAFKIGDKFGSIEEYCNYPYSHLFFNDKVIGKAITDNWQFRQIENGIKYGYLRKAELNNGYKLYEVTALVFDNYSYATKPFISKARFVAKNADEAEKKMIKYRYSGVFADNHGEHEYEYNDGSGVVKLKVVECNG